MTYTIDGNAFSTLEGFFEEISRVVIPGARWGHNLDAFNDILRGGFGTPAEGFELVWKDHAVSQGRLGYAETARQLEKRLTRCHPTNREHVAQDLAAAKSGSGSTVFDWLVDLIRDHGPGGEQDEDHVVLWLR
jgi:RNAse (barnase) inhibitor barstar